MSVAFESQVTLHAVWLHLACWCLSILYNLMIFLDGFYRGRYNLTCKRSFWCGDGGGVGGCVEVWFIIPLHFRTDMPGFQEILFILHLCMWPMVLSKVFCIALKVYSWSLLARGAGVMATSMALDWIWWIVQ